MTIEIILMILNLKSRLYQKKRATKRSKPQDIDECKIDSKIAQESIRKKIIKQRKKIFQCTIFKSQIKEEKYKYAIIKEEKNFSQYR